ncbi:MAG: M20/M25/M40 family metallo-hydrolase [Planctomycetales bacterium]|nr:M20/M25/M40 family metallo-hydrolase [Planctomycetales bacterium]
MNRSYRQQLKQRIWQSVRGGSVLASVLQLGLFTASVTARADEGLDRETESVVARVGGDIEYLASDELGGRGVGTEGIEIAANFIRDEFQRLGLAPGGENGTYFQEFPIEGLGTLRDDETWAVIVGADGAETKLVAGTDYQPQMLGGPGPIEAEMVFAGYGITSAEFEYDDYEGLDCQGKFVVVIRREPQQNDADSPFDGLETSAYATIRNKLATASLHGAAGIILVNDQPSTQTAGGDFLATPELFGTSADGIPFVHMSQAAFGKILAAHPLQAGDGTELKTLAEVEAAIDANLQTINGPLGGTKIRYQMAVDTVMTNNVIAVIEGEGPLADETIIVGAHYDHLGMGGFGSRTPDRTEVHNGADDNATGTAAVLELARRFANSDKKPARRIVFIAFSGEERGLVGSAHYVAHPSIPLGNIVAMVNFDMIGWLRNDALTIYGAASGSSFSEVIEAASGDTGLDLKPIDSGFAGSDHLPFVSKEIPALFLHTGLTDTYHTPDDDFETINVEGAVRVIDYSENLLWELANLEERPTFQAARPREPRRRLAYLGARINFSEDVKGLLVDEVTEDSPAAAAGLQTGDIVLAIGERELKTREDLIAALREGNTGDTVTIKIMRDGEEQSLEATYGRAPRGQ